MKSGRGQLRGTISTMPCHVQVANLGPSAILAASLRSQLAWFGRRDGRRGRRGLGMQSRPSTMAAVTASSGPRRLCHSGAARKTDMRSRVGVLRRRMYSGMKREGKSGPRAECTRPAVGAGVGRGRTEREEQMATSDSDAKRSVRESGPSGSVSRTWWVGHPPGRRRAGVPKMQPSSEKCPSGRVAKRRSASCHDAPARRE